MIKYIKIFAITMIFLFSFFPKAYSAEAKVRLGIDVLEKENFSALKNKKVGLITNHTGKNSKGESTIDVLFKNTKLVSLFSPEHGIRGEEDREGIESTTDKKTGLPINSLYGKFKRPTREMLDNIDVLVFDIQDIGARFYTYITTMGYCIEECAKYGKEFIVLDRPNPITGDIAEGEILEARYKHFAGYYCIPIRHGMTVGEIAMYHKDDAKLNLKLNVIKMQGWKRNMWLDQTGIEWVNTSPNMRSLKAATLYPGIGCFESTNISVGRGTPTPFEIIGAPWINSDLLLKELEKFNIKGVKFEKVKYTPDTSVYKGQECNGLKILITDRNILKSTDLFIYTSACLKKFPEFQYSSINRMTGSDFIRETLDNNINPENLIEKIQYKVNKFNNFKKKFLLY